jgi:6-phosphogluconolactonase
MKRHKKVFTDKRDLALFVAEELKTLADSADEVFVALSGGSTPQAIFDVWAADYGKKIKWNNIRFFWVDERCVAPDDAESNYGMTHKHLLSKIPMEEEHIFRVMGELHPMDALTEYVEEINIHVPRKEGLPVFDLVILGMGDDGHTASIFPHEIELWHSENICAIGHHPVTGQNRVTLTGGVINRSKQIMMIVTGASKAAKIKEIFNNDEVADAYPASLVDPIKCSWLLDKEAASLLNA